MRATTELIVEVEPEQLTTIAIAARAGVPVGTLYEYVEDVDALIDLALVQILDRFDQAIRAPVVGQAGRDALVRSLYQQASAFYRREPAFRAIRTGALFNRSRRELVGHRMELVLAEVAAAGVAAGAWARADEALPALRVLWAVGDAVLTKVFAERARGDAAALAMGEQMLLAAAAVALPAASSEKTEPESVLA